MSIEVVNISKTFNGYKALDGVNLNIATGELVALLGPSGSGKTTLLRIIAGLEIPDSGSVSIYGEDSTDSSVRERGVGFVFQHYALFRHMNVFENVAFGLRVMPKSRRPANNTINEKVHNLLSLVQIDWLADRYPAQLSGGQRQRVAIARALAVEPKMLLLDEPFGALDAKVRQELRRWIRKLHDEIHITSVFVTHDQEEALEVANRVVVINSGRVEQIGTPENVYEHPATPFVYNFLGRVNLFRGRLREGKIMIGDDQETSGGQTTPEEQALMFVRPHHIEIAREPGEGFHLSARVIHINRAGPLVKVELETQTGMTIHVEMSQDRFQSLRLRRNLDVFAIPRKLKVFPPEEHPVP